MIGLRWGQTGGGGLVRWSAPDLVVGSKERRGGEGLQEAACFSGWRSLWVPREHPMESRGGIIE